MSEELTTRLAGLFANLPQVEAVALGGSRTGGFSDTASDIDLYVYTRQDIPLAARRDIVRQAGGASRADIGLEYWGPGDEWFDAASGIEVDIVYFDAGWMQAQLERVIDHHQASLGYTTCFWHTARQSKLLFDREGWLAALQLKCSLPYPETLRRNIVSLNHPVLRTIIPSYEFQLAKAVKRGDLVSVNHRLAALLASYFDILFACNRVLHPGEKRLGTFARSACVLLPQNFLPELEAVLQAAGAPDAAFLDSISRLLDHLDELLLAEGLV